MSLIGRKPGALRNGAPFETLPEALKKLQAILLRREGGDRLMAQVLAAVPVHDGRAGGALHGLPRWRGAPPGAS